jgi:hypothetical protein
MVSEVAVEVHLLHVRHFGTTNICCITRHTKVTSYGHLLHVTTGVQHKDHDEQRQNFTEGSRSFSRLGDRFITILKYAFIFLKYAFTFLKYASAFLKHAKRL